MGRASTTRTVKLVAIGNSRGIRLPKVLLRKYGWGESVVVEEAEDGLILRRETEPRTSWEDTYRAMAAEAEDWSDFDVTIADGLD
ncbi:MAG: AbrB/MazE/SpoVT family DNA-binding domain-containing protein [Gemmatimonadota bacterium]|uniref:AbrB/MazE/SpoVT family DNA-binding domain-containing protein n=1 Tax=Candidatus Palauibacter scopulicola TaxID=3056741 RepID=UPI0023959C1B|nr:AbrB/MazE/SpoVT family DNA-binding domain-containing protein [Candidatus Palauibacter scopulicola]MDE2662457.1 AbrB/MazE/SpoVT family DNA-binding domain-containing protein [Candidatus Palauibacter scopulicola]